MCVRACVLVTPDLQTCSYCFYSPSIFFHIPFHLATSSVGAAEGIKHTRPSQQEIYAQAGVELKDGKVPMRDDGAAAAEGKV